MSIPQTQERPIAEAGDVLVRLLVAEDRQILDRFLSIAEIQQAFARTVVGFGLEWALGILEHGFKLSQRSLGVLLGRMAGAHAQVDPVGEIRRRLLIERIRQQFEGSILLLAGRQ